ncbi:hypothetical protein H0G86_008599 [Trichoderma simmonsii]|uniref:Uncharacterized protein n=1 Tax=Trichoderma simmonsii TaxID=1491479 RepID=A0A8G0LIV6_9HYPO|nr:hypothetical protein H0G86_008599 [Trichoderma simmonsii]
MDVPPKIPYSRKAFVQSTWSRACLAQSTCQPRPPVARPLLMLALAGQANARLFLLIGHPELSIGHSEFAGCRSSLFEQTGREIPDDQTPTHGSRIGPRIRARFGGLGPIKENRITPDYLSFNIHGFEQMTS